MRDKASSTVKMAPAGPRRPGRLQGKASLVTGGSRSIGRAIALGFAHEGAMVAVNYVADRESAEEVARAVHALGGSAVTVQADVSRAGDVDRMIGDVVQSFGKLDILVNNAGVLKRTPLMEISEEEWDGVMAVNLKGVFLCSQAAARQMIKQRSGVIVNMSSIYGELPGMNLTHYCCSKGGVQSLSRQLALELAPYGIRANAIAPGLIETDLNRADLADPVFRDHRLSRLPMKLVGQPEDVVGAAIFLASDESRLATGTTIYLDAGHTIG